MTLSTRILDRLRDDRGSTLVELLVAIPTTLVVGGAVMAISGVFATEERVNANRSEAIADQQVATARMTKDIRQARSATIVPLTGGGQQLTIDTYVGGQATVVVYACRPPVCTRQVGTAPPVRVLEGVQSITFTRTDGYVGLDARVEVDGATVAVRDGAGLTNLAP